MNLFTTVILEAKKTAIKKFGTYAFFDKGPREVMDIHSFARTLKKAGPDTCLTVLQELLGSSNDPEERRQNALLVEAFMRSFDNWDALWEAHGGVLESMVDL